MAVNSRYEAFGRTNQKRRTREALKAAARSLVRAGTTPTVTEVAEAALVSKSTAYRYFPTQEALLAEVLLDEALGPGLARLDEVARAPGTAAERLDAVVRADHALVLEHEDVFRTALRAMIGQRGGGGEATPRRPGNRLRYLVEALAPLANELGPDAFERVVAALALCVGIESIVVTRDICALEPADAEHVKRWAAGALLEAALRDARPQS